jgi:Resolvase, N terminal domain
VDLVQEVVEVESGKRNDRPAIAEALRLCRLHKATLVIAKLDRLARNVHFISSLFRGQRGLSKAHRRQGGQGDARKRHGEATISDYLGKAPGGSVFKLTSSRR